MQISTSKLRDAAQAEIDRRIEAIEEQYQAEVKAYEEAQAEWLKSPKVEETIKALQGFAKKLRAGKVVTEREAEEALKLNVYRHESSFFAKAEPQKPKAPRSGDLEALVAFLDTVEDATVSSSTLRDFGFRNLRQLL